MSTVFLEEQLPDIGIWKIQQEDGQLIYKKNEKYINDWNYWADVPSIPLKTERKRLLLVGESVARGFLYDPGYNLCGILEKIIDQETEGIMVDYVDLAKVSLQFDEMELLIESAAVLEPDFIVLFAGNNWDIFSMHTPAGNTNELLQQLGGKRSGQVKQNIEQIIEHNIAQFLQRLKERFADKQIIVVVPEFNLQDWKSSSEEQYIRNMSSTDIKRWINVRDEALTTYNNGNFLALYQLADQLIAIDETNPLGYELLAHCEINAGNYSAARNLLESARDMAMFGRTDSRPRCFVITRKTLLKVGRELGFHCIDLPVVFDKYLDGKLPGRSLFLDYCHLSATGLQLVATSICKVVIQLLKSESVEMEELMQRCPQPDNKTAALAHFHAAVTNAHFGQSSEIIKYHCQQALHLNDHIKQTFVDYAFLSCKRTTPVLCKEFVNMFVSGVLLQYQNGMSMMLPGYRKLLDIRLVNILISFIEENNHSVRKQIDELRKKEHGITNRTVNLLDPFYSKTTFYKAVSSRLNYLMASADRSHFQFFADKSEAVFDLVLRLKRLRSGSRKLTIVLNNKEVKTIKATGQWTQFRFNVNADLLTDGMNELQIMWPILPAFESETRYQADDFGNLWNKQYCNFGEIYMFKVRGINDEGVPKL